MPRPAPLSPRPPVPRYVVMVREQYVDEPRDFPFTLVSVDVVTLPPGVDGSLYEDPLYVVSVISPAMH
jgi:hypothetical protein